MQRFYETGTAVNAGTDEEQNQSPLLKAFQQVLVDLQAQLADSAEVAENQTHDQRTAGSAQIEGACAQRDVNAAQNGTSQNGQGKCTQTEFVHFKQLLLLQGTLFAGVYRSQLGTLFCHVCLQNLRHDLNEQNYADNAERVGNSVADCDLLKDRTALADGLLCSGKCRRTGQRTGQQANAHCRVHFRNQQRHSCADSCAGEDDDSAQKHIGLCVLLQVLEERGTGDQSDGCDKQDQTKALD